MASSMKNAKAIPKENQVNKSIKPKPKAKKTPPAQNGKETTATTINESKPPTTEAGSSPANSAQQKASATLWLASEIKNMMHGLGDCKRPITESAQLIEEILHQQMSSLLIQTNEIAVNRGARFISCEDILFLMRRDKMKLTRLIRHFKLKDLKGSLQKSVKTEDDEALTGTDQDVKSQIPLLKRTKLFHDFFKNLDHTGELVGLFDDSLFDEIKHERNVRADIQSRCMDQGEYLEFCESRNAGFCTKNKAAEFRDWLLKDGLTELKPNGLALELFAYLAYETVAEILDLAILVKKDVQRTPGDTLAPSVPSRMFNPELTSLYNSLKGGLISGESMHLSSPPCSPPSQLLGSVQAAINKEKNRKRLRSDAGISFELTEARAVTPDEIREAIHRYYQQRGPFIGFSRACTTPLRTRLLC